MLLCSGGVSALVLIPTIAFYLTIFTLGIALLPMMAASWLFLLLLAIMPAVLSRGWRGRVAWLCLACVGVGAALSIGPLMARSDVARNLPDEVRRTVTAPLQSVDISAQDEVGCDTLCWQLLAGEGVAYVTPSTKIAYERATTEVCQNLDPTFPRTAACMVVSSPPANSSDLRVDLKQESFSDPQSSSLFFTPVERSDLAIVGADGVLWQDGQLIYRVRTIWPMLVVANDRGMATYQLLERRRATPDISVTTAMTDIGLAPAPPPPTKTALEFNGRQFDEPAPRPQDAILVASALQAGIPLNNPHLLADIRRFLVQIPTKGPLNNFEKEVLAMIGTQPELAAVPGIGGALAATPDVAASLIPVEELYARAGQGQSDIARQTAMLLARRLTNAEPGTYADEAEAYRELLDQGFGNFAFPLMNAVGRMGFDPMPYLDQWMAAENSGGARNPKRTLIAACYSGPEWDTKIVEFAQNYLNDTSPNRSFLSNAPYALQILAARGEGAYVNNWFAQIDPDWFGSTRARGQARLERIRTDVYSGTCGD